MTRPLVSQMVLQVLADIHGLIIGLYLTIFVATKEVHSSVHVAVRQDLLFAVVLLCLVSYVAFSLSTEPFISSRRSFGST